MLLCDPFQGGTDDWKDPQSHRVTKCFTGPGRAQEDFPNGSDRGPLISCSSSDVLVSLMSLSSEKRRNKRLVVSNRDTMQRGDPHALCTEFSLSRSYRTVHLIMRWLVVGRRSPDARPL